MISNNEVASPRRHSEVMQVLSGLLMVLFVAVMSVTIIGTALPTMMAALSGSESQYTWIVTAMMLSATVATPVSGKLADMYDSKKLLIGAIGLFTLGSLLSGAVNAAWQLIFTRILQGLGMGSIMSLTQVVMALIIPPRERGRYNGYIGAIMAIANISGPLVGGFIVATPWLGWRWCLWISIPFSLAAMVVLWRFLKVPTPQITKPRIDFLGTALITASVSGTLIWLSLVGKTFAFASWQTAVMLALAAIFLVTFVLWELHFPEPIIPMWMFTRRTTLLAILGSISVGTALNAPPLFFTQFFQIAKDMNPALAGMALLPGMVGTFISSTLIGVLVSRIGRWKRFVVGGFVVMCLGIFLITLIDKNSPYWFCALGMFLLGAGQGASMQNLVLAVQNGVKLRDMGAATSTVTFCRSMGGAIGIQICGFVFTWEIARQVSEGMAKLGEKGAAMAEASTLELDKLTPAQQQVVRAAYAGALGDIFVPLLVLSLIGLVCVTLMKGSELISEYAEHEADRHQATERERELVRRALEKDQISKDLSALAQKRGQRVKTGEEHPAEDAQASGEGAPDSADITHQDLTEKPDAGERDSGAAKPNLG
ncbi:MDR family MFS transporter [Varibaculum massiliense]|uniref:MDR family MFS transporter n=1 Tax=Varibaculum massiliense TaxID=1852372 RepID=UPI0008DAE797|nr:MDR family MFS transporter [Varibaculum massiliense]